MDYKINAFCRTIIVLLPLLRCCYRVYSKFNNRIHDDQHTFDIIL